MKKYILLTLIIFSSLYSYSQDGYIKVHESLDMNFYFRNCENGGSELKIISSNDTSTPITIDAVVTLGTNSCKKDVTIHLILYRESHLCFDICDLKYINSISVKLL